MVPCSRLRADPTAPAEALRFLASVGVYMGENEELASSH